MSTPRRLFVRGSWAEASRVTGILRKETVGGALLLIAATAALVWANSPWAESYDALRDFKIGPESLHLNLSLATWAADGLLAIFFFMVGLELKREFVQGDLRDPSRAAIPIVAAIGGMVVPALIFVVFNLNTGEEALRGWAIPTATDIAFAVAVLAVISTHLPSALRIFLLTLAVVDDLLAIIVIAVFYTSDLKILPLLLALIPIAIYAILVQRRVHNLFLLIPIGVVAWVLVHESGIHATIAGVLLGFTVPVVRSMKNGGESAGPGMAEIFEHMVRPVSAGFAVPVFAFFAAGVNVGGLTGYVDSLQDPIVVGIVAGLVLGKAIGILGTTYLMSKFTHAKLDSDLSWFDVLGVALLAGIGFTVSLLIGELAYGPESLRDEHVKVGVLTGSVLAAVIASIVLRARNRAYRRIHELETRDADRDGIPDVYQERE
ncbi:Na+/H+ antiporter NhaA [Lolliginicoccus suaedae]|uniref:Na+/H+ antiporter NhaA n=1 Tax=Lolliginicoccus suaedae TaxID=2605429 RepID=UPI0011EFB44A|nr:Na+/H+ antiporter NhaA [Lolliginicoccus suaedae]